MKRLMNDDLGKALKTLLDVRVLLVFCATLVGLGWGGNRWVDSKLVWAGELRQYIQSVEKDQHVQNLQTDLNTNDILIAQKTVQWKELDQRTWKYRSRYLRNPGLMPEDWIRDIESWEKEMEDLDREVDVLLEDSNRISKEIKMYVEPGVPKMLVDP